MMQTPPDPLVVLRGVSKRYRGVIAVRNVTFSIDRGEIVGLIGANGAGKSTLMRMLAGDEPPDEGTIIVDGAEVAFGTPRAALEEGIARVPQELDLVEDQSVAESILMGDLPSRWGVVSKHRLRARARELMHEVGLDVDPHAESGSLTPVHQRLLTVAQALARRPRILILDEPTAALPTETAARLQPLLERLAVSGVAVIYISHRFDEIRAVCTRVVAMRDGAVSGTLAREEIAVDRMVTLVGGSERREAAHAERSAESSRSPDDEAPVIEVFGVSGHRVDRVDMTVERGELVGIGGLYGSGRSELLRLIAGVQRPTAGSVRVRGAPGPRSSREAATRRIGYVAEGRSKMLFRELTVSANASVAVLSRLSWARIFVDVRRERAAVSEIGRRMNLKGDVGAEMRTLSGGNQQKVCLARWMLLGCDVLLLDEPTVGIDVHARAEIHGLLRRLVAEGMTIVIASAEPEELALLCNRVLVLVEGQVAQELRRPFTGERVIRASYRGASTAA